MWAENSGTCGVQQGRKMFHLNTFLWSCLSSEILRGGGKWETDFQYI